MNATTVYFHTAKMTNPHYEETFRKLVEALVTDEATFVVVMDDAERHCGVTTKAKMLATAEGLFNIHRDDHEVLMCTRDETETTTTPELKSYPFAPAHEDNPLNEPHVFDWPEGMHFAITLKSALDFECEEATNVEEDDNKFLPFAIRKSGLREHGFYATEKEVEADEIWGASHVDNIFVWNKAGECVNGAF